MKLLYGYLKNFKGLLVLALFLAAVNQTFSMLDPWILQLIIDNYASNKAAMAQLDTWAFFKGAGLLILAAMGVAMVSRIAKAFQDYYVNTITQKLGVLVYTDGLQHSLQMPFQAFEDQRSGETLGILQKVRSDSERLVSYVVNVLFPTIIGIIFVAGYAINIHWAIAPVYFGMVPILGWLVAFLSKRIKRIQKKIVDKTTALAGATTESLRNIELVKSLGLVNQETDRLNSNTRKILKLELEKVRSIRMLSFIQGTFVNLLRNTILLIMLYLIFSAHLTMGQFMALFIYSFFIFGPLQSLGEIINVYRETEVSLDNFNKILNTPKERKPEEPVAIKAINEIEFRNVSFQHETATVKAVDDISFKARTGETIAFVGPSGSGKTTMVKLLVGLYNPEEGNIFYNGISSEKVDLDELREQIGLVTQDTHLFSGTIKENLKFVAPDATDEECMEVAEKAALNSLLERADKSLDTVIGEGGMKVSGGEKQRLAIARALLRYPKLLVFDEATSALDSLTEEQINKTIQDVSRQQSHITFLIAHRLSTIMHADRIYVLERGKVVESGRHDQLLQQKGLYYAMWRQQIGERERVLQG